MLRKILAGLAGILIANATFILARNLTGLIFGVPAELNPNEAQGLSASFADLPVGAFLLLLAGYALGSYLGGFSMNKISRWNSLILPLVLGIMGTLGWVAEVVGSQFPAWVVIIGFFCFIPFALLGYRSSS